MIGHLLETAVRLYEFYLWTLSFAGDTDVVLLLAYIASSMLLTLERSRQTGRELALDELAQVHSRFGARLLGILDCGTDCDAKTAASPTALRARPLQLGVDVAQRLHVL